MRDRQAYHNNLALCVGKKEVALNQEIPTDALMLVPLGAIMSPGRATEAEEVLAGGGPESEREYVFGAASEMSISWTKMQCQHLGFAAAFGLGSVSTVAAGSTGYLHTITPLINAPDARRDLPSTTMVQRLGNELISRVFSGVMVDSLNLSFRRGEFVNFSTTLKNTGKFQSNLLTEQVSGNSDDTTVTLAAKGVSGSTAAARLDSVHSVSFKLDSGGGWQEVHFSAVSDASPAVITITPPDSTGTNAGTYKIIYVPTNAQLDTGSATADPVYDVFNQSSALTDAAAALTPDQYAGCWLRVTSGTANGHAFKISSHTATVFSFEGYDLPSAGVASADTYEIVQFGWLPYSTTPVSEPAFRIDNCQVIVGGDWNGTTFSGGRSMGGDIEAFEWSYSNSLSPAFLAGNSDYASAVDKGEVSQTIRLDRRMVDAIHQVMMEATDGIEAEYFGIRVVATGSEYETGHNYSWELIFPRLALGASNPSADGRKLSESNEIKVKHHPTYGSVIAKVKNKVSAYAV